MTTGAQLDHRGRVADEVAALGAWMAGLRWPEVPAPVRNHLSTVLFDVLAANTAGARTPGQRATRAVWPCPEGDSPIVAGGRCSDAMTAAFLNGQATVCLELDEGNKYAKGHPAAHVFPAVLALAAEQDVTGETLACGLLAGYEVAARFGRATTLRSRVHPHGNWGVAGAAAGCARILGLDEERTAAALDAGTGMPIAGHFDSALDGNPVRDAWIGAANQAGITAARLAAAGVAHNTGTAAHSLGELLGEFDPVPLCDELGTRFDITNNYFKRHASCSYTHPVADLAIEARDALFDRQSGREEVAPHVAAVDVVTHAAAARLDRAHWDNALSAMFSVPFVAATALADGSVSPESVTVSADEAPSLAGLASRVTVREDVGLTERLPHERGARVTVRLDDGRHHTAAAPNPVGDTDFHPFGRDELSSFFGKMLGTGGDTLRTLHAVADGLPTVPGTRSLAAPLAALPGGTNWQES